MLKGIGKGEQVIETENNFRKGLTGGNTKKRQRRKGIHICRKFTGGRRLLADEMVKASTKEPLI